MMKKIAIILLLALLPLTPTAWAAGGAEEAKVSTQRTFQVGSFVDATDGLTPETAVTITAMDEKVLCPPNGGTCLPLDNTANSWTAVTNGDGDYFITIAGASLTAYGKHTLVFNDDDVFLPTRCYIDVVSANYWDTKYGADVMQADVTQVGGDAITDNNDGRLEVNIEEVGDSAISETVAGHLDVNVTYWEDDAVPGTADGIPDVDTIQWDDAAITDADANPGVDVVTMGANVITSASINDGAISDVDVDNDVQIDVVTIETGDATDALDAAANTVTVTSIGANVITDAACAADFDTLVNDEVSDVMKTDTISELGVAAPAARPTFETGLMLLYMDKRNKTETTASEHRLTNDAETVITEADISDAAGTFTKEEFGAVD